MPPVPAWACSPGVRRLPFLSTFLPEFDFKPAPGPDIQTVLGWGLKPTSAFGRRLAARRGLPYVALEDGFLRSVGLGEAGATSLSLSVDRVGVYYDATRPSQIEQDLLDADDWFDAALSARTRALLDRLVETGLSKTNLGEPLDRSLIDRGRKRILIVDQTLGDASISMGLATPETFADMIRAARAEHPGAQLIVKRHPAVAAGKKEGCIPAGLLGDVTLIDRDVAAADLLGEVDAVHVVTSGLGFEALWRGLPVTCYGAPFYSGWGLTDDKVDTGRRGVDRPVEAVTAAALIRLSRYVDPVTGDPIQVEAAIERLVSLRDRNRRLKGFWALTGFAPAKRRPIEWLLNAPQAETRFIASPERAAAEARANDGRLAWWAGKESEQTRRAAASFAGTTVRVEDGFIRSRGLGSDFFAALSVALDDQGVYYDPAQPSRLETLLETTEPTPVRRARADALRAAIVGGGLTKYNLPGATPDAAGWPTDRPRLLVVGQVENDKSIERGCEPDLRTNAQLIDAARADHPDAFLIYRNHPDVLAGNRPGKLDPSSHPAIDATADGMDILACLDACDRLATLTSLTGFEALLRGKPVSTYGRPFYSGWGLTDDRQGNPRRTRRITLDDLVHAALIDYPIYIAPNGWPCEAEDLVHTLTLQAGQPATSPPNQIARWFKGIRASLDRRAPPAY